jgi:transcription termination factor Rho
LSRECAEHRIWPAININKSGTRKEDLLMDKEEYERVIGFRRAVATKEEKDAMTEFLTFL